jgi:hypothetical protein
MKRTVLAFLILVAVLLAACAKTPAESNTEETEPDTVLDTEGFDAALRDWALGSDFGVVSGRVDTSEREVVIEIEAGRQLSDQDRRDIEEAISEILSLHLSPADAALEYGVVYISGEISAGPEETDDLSTPPDSTPVDTTPADSGSTVNLIFIHHSCGENWLRDGLNAALNGSGYHVADIYYGWRGYGDHTDTSDWPRWFSDDVMDLVYNEIDAMTAANTIAPAEGENTVVMFKSCFPNSDVGTAIGDEQAVYNSLIPYFEAHSDKMFILVTPPPMIHISHPDKTRELCNWLIDSEDGWLDTLSTGNVFVFDFYNVLTHPDAHHCYADGEEVHTWVAGADELYYDSGGDDHPNEAGNAKAAGEFMGLLNHWYAVFSSSRE